MTDLYTLLYLSTMAPDAEVSAVGEITRQGRVSNAERGITGLLVFDGSSFLQCLEGSEPALSLLLQRLRSDPRHVGLLVLSWQPLGSRRRHMGWDLGYQLVNDDGDALERFRNHRGDEALAAYDHLVLRLDLAAPSHPIPPRNS